MELLQNPFHILTATPRHNRQQLIELADERSLLIDAHDCDEARSYLINPRKRLSAEIAWLPGIGLKRTGEVLSLLKSSPTELLNLDKLPSISRANLLAAGLTHLFDSKTDDIDIISWILAIAVSFEDINPENVMMIINEERIVSGFPEISDISIIETEIQERRRYYRHVIKSALDNLSSKELVTAITAAVVLATDDGDEPGPILISDLVDSYEVSIQEFMEKEERTINDLVEKLQRSVDAGQSDYLLTPMVNQLISVVKNWDMVVQPIQVSSKGRGLDHDASHRVAGVIRDLAIYMFNAHGKLEYSQQITRLLLEVFAEVSEVAERAAEDADTLKGIEAQRVEEKNRAEQWREEITYETDVGAIFKDKLRISLDGIEWKGRIWKLDSITRIRWGGTKHSVNGVPTGTTYTIFLGNESNSTSIELKREATYSNFIDRLWKAVGVRLLMEYLEGLKEGKQYRFGSTIISDRGIELIRKKLFASDERVFCHWDELVIWNGAGVFCIEKKGDKKLATAFSYLEHDNIHVLEHIIRMFWKKGGDRLSSLLND